MLMIFAPSVDKRYDIRSKYSIKLKYHYFSVSHPYSFYQTAEETIEGYASTKITQDKWYNA